MKLCWPRENADDPQLTSSRWHHAGSNYCLDFHGDPARSELCVFSDGNHHMALQQSLDAFRRENRLQSIFYCTTPPAVYLDWIKSGGIELGNLRLSREADLIIGPEDILARLQDSGQVQRNAVFAQSTGNSLLVRRGNPAGIGSIRDLYRPGVRLFISNPKTETASHAVYRQTVEELARREGLEDAASLFDSPQRVLYGELIHHREAPQAVADGDADAAIVYAHLALRFTRIFPEVFETVELPPGEGNITSRYAVGITRADDALAHKLYDCFAARQVAEIYRQHGLQPLAS